MKYKNIAKAVLGMYTAVVIGGSLMAGDITKKYYADKRAKFAQEIEETNVGGLVGKVIENDDKKTVIQFDRERNPITIDIRKFGYRVSIKGKYDKKVNKKLEQLSSEDIIADVQKAKNSTIGENVWGFLAVPLVAGLLYSMRGAALHPGCNGSCAPRVRDPDRYEIGTLQK